MSLLCIRFKSALYVCLLASLCVCTSTYTHAYRESYNNLVDDQCFFAATVVAVVAIATIAQIACFLKRKRYTESTT